MQIWVLQSIQAVLTAETPASSALIARRLPLRASDHQDQAYKPTKRPETRSWLCFTSCNVFTNLNGLSHPPAQPNPPAQPKSPINAQRTGNTGELRQ